MNESAATPDELPWPVRLRQYLRQLAVRICIYLLIYVVVASVTIGPCFWYWFESAHANGPRWIARFYAPLVWLCDHVWPIGWLVNQYVNWWIL